MKIAIVNNMIPFVWGGAEELAKNLQKNLQLRGHDAQLIRIPFKWDPASAIPSQMLIPKFLDLSSADKVIALKFPAYLIEHPHKIIWLIHQHRQAYDLYDAKKSNILNNKEGNIIKQGIKIADEEVFYTCKQLFTISQVVSDRLIRYHNMHSIVLTPPLNDPEIFNNLSYENYILATGRINQMKRQHLLLHALSLTKKPVKIIIVGPPDNLEEEISIRALVKKLQIEDRVKLDLRFLPRHEYASYVNNALAIACVPYNEELGYVAMEAACAEKALLSTVDSGGILALAKPAQTGWVVAPTPEKIAEALDEIWTSPMRVHEYGKNIKLLWNSLNITWDHTIEELLK